MAHLMTRTRILVAITGSAAGWGFGFGGFFAVIGLIAGELIGRNISLLGRVASQVQGKPNTEQMGIIQAAQKQLLSIALIS